MKRKQLNLTERELQIVIDAMKNEWWMDYDPLIETNVQPNYDLLKRFEESYEKLQERVEVSSTGSTS
jgi:hypothetical protein